jgi:hypothetical protein
MTHGTIYAYARLHCHCDTCRKVATDYRRDRRHRQKAAEGVLRIGQGRPRPQDLTDWVVQSRLTGLDPWVER